MKGTPNLNFVGGDRFNSISSADAVLLKWILHDWNEELSLKILNNYKEAISSKGKRGKAIIIDIAIDEAAAECTAALRQSCKSLHRPNTKN
ncbi:hypothetical protein AAZX31_13G158100 [Glycine max]